MVFFGDKYDSILPFLLAVGHGAVRCFDPTPMAVVAPRFCPFLNQVVWFFLILSCMSYLYILDINLLLVISFASIFSHLVGCLFVLLMGSFSVRELLSLIRSNLFIFPFVSFALGERSKKYCCDLCHRVFCLCFPLRV